jgi:hypothetical protein
MKLPQVRTASREFVGITCTARLHRDQEKRIRPQARAGPAAHGKRNPQEMLSETFTLLRFVVQSAGSSAAPQAECAEWCRVAALATSDASPTHSQLGFDKLSETNELPLSMRFRGSSRQLRTVSDRRRKLGKSSLLNPI